MRKTAILGAIAALTVAAPFAGATGFSYNLVEGALLSGDDYDGLGIYGSMELSPEFFASAGIDAVDFDGSDADGSLLSIGGGYTMAINSQLDVVAIGSLKRIKIDGAKGDLGFGLGVGLRGRLLDQLELHGGFEFVDFDDYDSDTQLKFGGRWYFTPQFAAGVDITDDDAGSVLRLTARYDFGNRM